MHKYSIKWLFFVLRCHVHILKRFKCRLLGAMLVSGGGVEKCDWVQVLNHIHQFYQSRFTLNDWQKSVYNVGALTIWLYHVFFFLIYLFCWSWCEDTLDSPMNHCFSTTEFTSWLFHTPPQYTLKCPIFKHDWWTCRFQAQP